MANKEQTTVYVSGTAVDDYTATATFTTDSMLWEDFNGFTLSVYNTVLNGASASMSLEIQVSNEDTATSFNTYENFKNMALPSTFSKSQVKFKYIRFIYTPTNVLAGSVITFTLNKLTL